MTTANINVRVDAELKKEAEGLFNDLGLNMSSAITMFLKSADVTGFPLKSAAMPSMLKPVLPLPSMRK